MLITLSSPYIILNLNSVLSTSNDTLEKSDRIYTFKYLAFSLEKLNILCKIISKKYKTIHSKRLKSMIEK